MAKPSKASRDSLHESEHVGRGRPDAPLSDQGAGGNALDLFAILRTLHAHGSVGNDVPLVVKLKFQIPQKDRYQQMLEYLRVTPSVRDVVVSGGDIANTPIATLEEFCSKLMDLPNIKDIRLATKA